MNVQKYLFQSPYASSVQVGRPDPSSKPEESSSTNTKELSTQVKQEQPIHPTQVESANVTQSVQPTISSEQLLDVYA